MILVEWSETIVFEGDDAAVARGRTAVARERTHRGRVVGQACGPDGKMIFAILLSDGSFRDVPLALLRCVEDTSKGSRRIMKRQRHAQKKVAKREKKRGEAAHRLIAGDTTSGVSIEHRGKVT